MYKFSSFSSYGLVHGNKKDFTGCLIGSDDGKKLTKLGFGVEAPISARGTIATDGTVELILSHSDPAGTVHSYDSDGSLWFNVSLNAIRLRSGNRVEQLTRAHDIHISKLIVQADKGVVRLVSTDASHFGKSKKRNGLARVPTSSLPAAPETSRPVVGFVKKMGDNYALLMSASVVERAGLAEGSRVDVEPTNDGRLVVSRSNRHFTLDELLAGMTPEREHPHEDDAPRGEETL